MENYLYFRKMRPTTFSHTVTSANVGHWANAAAGSATSFIGDTALTALGGGDDFDSSTEIASCTVTHNAAATLVGSGTGTQTLGTGYSAADAGATTTVNLSVVDVTNSRIVIDEASGTGTTTKDTTNGVTLVADDVVTFTFREGLETAIAYPVSRLKGIHAGTANTETVLHFDSFKNDSTNDVITITHTAGKFEQIAKAINEAANGYPGEGKMITVLDGKDIDAGNITKGLRDVVDAGVSDVTFELESGY